MAFIFNIQKFKIMKNNQNVVTATKLTKRFFEHFDENRKFIHIIWYKNRWRVRKPHLKHAIRIFKNRDVAFLFANIIAKDDQYIIVHNQNGEVDFRTRKLLISQNINYYNFRIKVL